MKKRKKAEKTPVKDREVTVYKTGDVEPSSLLCLHFVASAPNEEPEEDKSNEETMQTLSYMTLKKENEEALKFHNRALKELQRIRKMPVFSKGYVKFKFPDTYILRAAFSPSESALFLYTFLKDVCK
eukprot:TRINITY_DN12314_c0_g1_i4.p1 TRINITY_DN12314_c0_g1~~TRINITY_DN12314_c0_g1_i4.p1  ORF type:complete len:127 (+),score=41.67 TRINITY_DN12314_c0_g1_i4:363-743(+)